MLDFPASPTNGQLYNGTNGVTYQWVSSPAMWVAQGSWTPPPQGAGSFINAISFGVTIGTTADQSASLQAAIDYAEANKLKLFLPAGYIRIDNTIYLGRRDPVWVEGQQAHAFFGFTDNQIDDVTVLHCANLPSNVAAVEIGALVTTGVRDGVTLKNVSIYRPTPSAAGAGDKGVWIKSCTKPCLEDMVIYGFDVGLYCGINSDGSRGTYLGNFCNVRIDQSGNYGGLIESCVDCLFDHCWFGGATLASMAIIAPTLGTLVTNGNYWEHCTFVASVGTVPINSCRVDVGFWNSFDTCDFEQAAGETFKADYTAAGNSSGHATARVDVVLMNCWLNNGIAANTGLINMKDVNFEIIGGRAGNTVGVDSAIKVTQSFFGIATFDSCIVGMQISFQAITGVAVSGTYEGLRIVNCTIIDNTATGLPCVTMGGTGGRIIVAGNRFKTTHARGYTDAGELVGAGSIFSNNVLTNNTFSDNHWSQAIGGPALAFAGQTPKTAEYGVSQAAASRLYTRHTNDTGGIFHYWYKTRQTVPGGARVATASGDSISFRRFYADDGAADQEVMREIVNVDGLTGGSWEILTKLAAGSLLSRLKIDNTGLAVFTGAVKTLSTTVGALPAAATAGSGARAQVSDSTVVAAGNFGAAVVGAGANNVPVYSDGAAWRIG